MTGILSRTASLTLSVALLFVTLFALIQALPTGPWENRLAKLDAQGARSVLTPSQKQALESEFGYDLPLPERFVFWTRKILTQSGYPLAKAMLTSAKFAGLALLGFLALSLFLGTLCASQEGRWVDSSVLFFLSILASLPSFLFAKFWILFNPGGTLHLDTFFLQAASPLAFLGPTLCYLIAFLPVGTLLYRGRLLVEKNEPYAIAAKARGIPTSRVLLRHLSPSSIPLLFSCLPNWWTTFLSTAILIEPLFQIPGIGSLVWRGLSEFDYSQLVLIVLLEATGRLVLSYLAENALWLLNPKVGRA